MSLDINELVRLVKRAAVDAVRADAPMAICYGVVVRLSLYCRTNSHDLRSLR